MVQSVELLLDDAGDAYVRAQWAHLEAAGLPHQGRHRDVSNRPHVTLAARRAIDAGAEPALRAATAALPVPARVGALACFGRGRFVLVRLVLADVRLLAVHAAVADALGPDPDDPDARGNLAPGRWTPHVTLARRLTPGQVGVAVAALSVGGAGRGSDGTAASCRRWDGDARREWLVQ